jgi:toxin-antitoxin system PIN domain toxin
VIAVDTNILVYAHRVESKHYVASRGALRELIESDDGWAVPWPCVHEFLATVTKRTIAAGPTPIDLALDQLLELFRSPGIVLLAEHAGYFRALAALLRSSNVTGGAVHDARIAALCLSHGISELWTADRDFARFPQLKTRNPLV